MDDESPSVVALRRAITEAGGQSGLARMIGVSQQAVSRWVLKGKSLPAEYVEAVSLGTRIPMKDLRPDLPFGDETPTALPALPPTSTIDEIAP